MSPHEAAAIGLDLCRALSAVHRAGLVHRDVKAQNVMREANGRVVSRWTSARANRSRTTPAARPLSELLLTWRRSFCETNPLTPAADLYSLGVLLYHLVTGGYPVVGTSIEEIRSAHQLGRRQYPAGCQARPAGQVRRGNRAIPHLRRERPVRERRHDGARPRRSTRRRCCRSCAFTARGRETSASLDVCLAYGAWGALLAVLTVAVVLLVLAARSREDATRTLRRRRPRPADRSSGRSIFPEQLPSSAALRRTGVISHMSITAATSPLVDPASGAPRQLTKKGDIDEASEMASAVSADGTRVAYAWRTLDNSYEMRVIGTDGKRLRSLVRRDDVHVPHPIQWSRDGRRILSLLVRTDRTNALAMVDSATGGVTVIKDLGRVRPQHASHVSRRALRGV